MFTGFVEETGTVRRVLPGTLVVEAALVLSDLKLGDSIAVDGTCLTVVERSNRTFTVNVQPETLRRTTLGSLTAGRRVNLERALQFGGRLGGHIVQGHIEGTGTITELRPDGDGLILRIETAPSIMRYVVAKGFIAINGVSLTVVDAADTWFTVALIRYTRDHIAMLDGGEGTTVNLETDVVARYVERLLAAPGSQPEGSGTVKTGLSLEKLREAGFAG